MGLALIWRNTWVPLHEHLRILDAERERFAIERDRRYAEVSIEREKALKIKDEERLAALELARNIQTYKDQQHNGLLEQLGRERSGYASKEDLNALAEKLDVTIKPLTDFVSRSRGGIDARAQIAAIIGVVATVITLIIKFL